MKRLTLVMIAFIVSLTMNAKEVTEQEALQKAQKFMQGKQFKQTKNLRRAPSTGSNAYYIFNAEDSAGFVIVAGDDRMTEILGYSEHGEFDFSKMPDNVKWLLSYYQHVIDSVGKRTSNVNGPIKRAPVQEKNAISPLVNTQWGQDAPFNNFCLELDGQKCVTGCVATAVAQVLNYYQWPKGQINTIEAYTTETSSINMPPLESTSFEWNNMTDADVARLMQYCGQAFKMDYGINSSGADFNSLYRKVFIDLLGYSNSFSILNRDLLYYDDELWENILYKELENNRIVLYEGISWNAPSHVWIVDGYKDGFFHMNWGWAGYCDGYYKLSGIVDELISVYNMNHLACVGMMSAAKAEDGTSKVFLDVSEESPRWMWFSGATLIKSKGYVTRPNVSEEFPYIGFSCTVCSDVEATHDIGFGLLDADGTIHCIAEEQHAFSANEDYMLDKYVSLNGLPNGNYRITVICKNKETGEWELAIGATCTYIEVTIDDLTITLHGIPDGTHFKLYEEIGVKEIDGVTYLLYNDYENHLAEVLPKQITEKYSGEIVIPSEVEYEGTIYRVGRIGGEQAFVGCEDLTSLTLGCTSVERIVDCPKLSDLKLLEGVAFCTNIGRLPLLESIELPATLYRAQGNGFITECENLKSIRFLGKMVQFIQEPPQWDDASLPALTDIYFPSEVPPAIIYGNEPISDLVPANTKAKIHIPVGSLPLYKQSNWKNWEFVEDMPTDNAVTWGYCHSDAITTMGTGVVSSNNYVEYAMRVPQESMEVYKGSKITKIQVCSPYKADNDYGYEDYEYVYITKRGTDYLVKQPFKIVRGTWNTIELETPYTITGEEIFVGFGRYGVISVTYSDMTEVKDAAYGRALGDDYDCVWEPGKWQKLGNKAHPLPIRFVIEGADMPTGLAACELQIPKVDATSNAPRKAPQNGQELQATIRNRSLERVTSYTVEWSIDGQKEGNKTIETTLLPNACETITVDLSATIQEGNHVVSLDVTSVNEGTNELYGKNSPVIEMVGGVEGVLITAKDHTREYGETNPVFEYESKTPLEGTPEISCEATLDSPVGNYPIKLSVGSVENENPSFVDGTLTITKASLTITAQAYTIKQGEALPTFEATYEGFKNEETADVLTTLPVLSTTATSVSEPGEYEIAVSGAEAQNYEISYVAGKLTITEADPLVVTAKDYTIEYGDALPAFEFTSEGATIEGSPAITCEATSKSPVGTYPIVITKGSVANYNDTYVNGTLTIEKAPLTITAQDYTIKQGEALPTFEATYEGFKNNETADVLTTLPTLSTTATSASEPGEYEIAVSGAEARNYEISYVAGKLTITEASAILNINVEHPVDIYDLQGNKIRSKATSLKGLRKGVYIINGSKVVVQ